MTASRFLRWFLPLFALTAAPASAQVGGGFADGGLWGEYFADPAFQDSRFQRRDVRIRFDWGAERPVGGSIDEPYASFPRDHFSVRWTGRLLPRFSEPYTFHAAVDRSMVVEIRAPGAKDWTRVVDQTEPTKEPLPGPAVELKAGLLYDIRIDYIEDSGPARAVLLWSSPSTPREIIDPATEIAMNHTAQEQAFADAIKTARLTWEKIREDQPVTTDEDGWPTSDAGLIVSEYLAPFDPSPLELGINRLSFRGKADVTAVGNCFVVPGSIRYDEATNTTTGQIEVKKNGWNIQRLDFTNTSRTGQPDGPKGITDIRLMRPVAPGSQESFRDGMWFHPQLKESYARLTALRYQRVNDQTRTWEERVRPSYFNGNGSFRPYVYAARYGYNLNGRTGMAHELEIMLCNEIGKDYYVTVPHLATVEGRDAYIRKLALLIKYGSDGREPYTSVQENPVYPPLNPNLNVHVEVSNELWNFAQLATYAPFFDYLQLMKDKADAQDADFRILNHDNLPLTKNAEGQYDHAFTWKRRYWALYLKQISEVFREVFGDADMPGNGQRQPRVRPFYTWQYADTNGTAQIGLHFMDLYFNNGDGVKRVEKPMPVNHYFFTGGGAGYYSVVNKEGIVPGIVPNAGFEEPAAPGAQAAPAAAAARWTFGGDAGIVAGGSGGDLNPPKAMEGAQMAYFRTAPGAPASATVRLQLPPRPETNRYGLVFRWVQRTKSGASEPDRGKMKILANGTDITPRGGADQPQPWREGSEWKRLNYWQGNYYFSETFEAPPDGGVELRFETDTADADQVVFLDEVQLTSIDAFYAGGLGGGSAMGQGDNSYFTELRTGS